MTDDASLEARHAWIHELRNAVNSTGLSLAVVRRLLAQGRLDQALQYLDDAEQACQRSRSLSAEPPFD